MHTTQQWLNLTLNSKPRMMHWLKRQYIGEFTAAVRLGQLVIKAKQATLDIQKLVMLDRVQKEEAAHAVWIANLLLIRNAEIPQVHPEPSRYWEKVLLGKVDIQDLFAAGYHAEMMRLERIRGLVEHPKTPDDIRKTFVEILRDEEGHAHVFKILTTDEQRAQTFEAHKAGMEAMGLVN